MNKQLDTFKLVAKNSRATFEYFILETYEAGISLVGTEVKSLRGGKASIIESHVAEVDGFLSLVNADIPEYDKARFTNHYPRRPRKLLLHKKQINKIAGAIQRKGFTVIPLRIYFNNKNIAKVELGLSQGKKQHDKRQTIKDREWDRQKSRVLKDSRHSGD
jgi:SsrA-binding protein